MNKAKECRWLIEGASGKTPKPAPVNQDTGNNYSHWFWASDEKKHAPSSEADPEQDKKIDLEKQELNPDDEANQILVDNGNISAATFLNLLKSKGLKLTREADQSTANTPALRTQTADKNVKKKKKSSDIYVPTSAKSAKAHESLTESAHSSRGNVSTTLQFRFREAGKDIANPTSANKFRVVLIQEGLGNLKDGYYYTKDALKSAVPVFEGKKMYVDHPDRLEEETRPERSVRDIVGHFESVEYKEAEDGTGMIEADLCVLPDEPFQWVRALMRHATGYSEKFPDKDFVGLSINASGDALPMEAKEFLKQEDLPKSALPKIENAVAEGLSEIKIVKNIADAVSCDLVTEAGARGKVLKMLEAEMDKDMKKEAEEKKENDKEKEESKKEGDDKEKEDDKAAAKDDGAGDEDHDDADQDKELIKSMLKKHLGDEAMEDEAAHKAAKHYMAAYEAMGHDKKEAADRACEAMKMSKHAKEAMEAEEAGDADDDQDDQKKKPMPKEEAKKESAEVLKLRGENAKLRETLGKREVTEYLDKVLKDSKLSMAITKAFKESCKEFKNKKDIDEKFKLFVEGIKAAAVSGEASSGYEDAITISTEKTNVATLAESKSFADCAD